MILAMALLYSLLVAWLLGGRLSSLRHVHLKLEWLVPVGLMAQMVFTKAPILQEQSVVLVWQFGALLLLVVAAANWRYAGMKAIACGVCLNALAIILNLGMPVAPEALLYLGSDPNAALREVSQLYLLAHEGTVLPLLGDVLPMPGPSPLRSVASLGDMLLLVGVASLILEMTTGSMLNRAAVSTSAAAN